MFFHNQKLGVRKQVELGEYWGNLEVHPQGARVPGIPAATVMWHDYYQKKFHKPVNFKSSNYSNWDANRYPNVNAQTWHSDFSYLRTPAGVTHLHLDHIPDLGGDTMWASGYAAYDKLSEEMKRFLDGKKAVFVSMDTYLDRNDPFGSSKPVERVHPIIRTHPVTGWKSLNANRQFAKHIVGLTPVESDLILNYLFDIYEKNADIQVRLNWKSDPGYGTSAIWDNRCSVHRSVWDLEDGTRRHGTRITSLADEPFYDPNSKSQREALGLPIAPEE